MSSATVSYELLQLQNAATSNAVIQFFDRDPAFEQLSTYEGHLTQQRDAEDDAKLRLGIQYAQEKGVLDPHFTPEPYTTIDVLHQTPDRVADTILQHVQQTKGENDTGYVIVLVGLSGTGKGTTVSKLVEQLQQAGQKVVTWSNGNLFRSVTLLAATWCEQNDRTLDDALTKDNLESFMGMLSFGQHPETQQYDTRIQGLGYDAWISAIQNTELKQPKVSKNIPTVAQVTQGEVILFAASAIEQMKSDASGLVVLLEGRAQTVDYVRSPHRFELVLSDDRLIGQRRAAQRLMAAALHDVAGDFVTDETVTAALQNALQRMVQEIEPH